MNALNVHGGIFHDDDQGFGTELTITGFPDRESARRALGVLKDVVGEKIGKPITVSKNNVSKFQ